jgi:hypothetical protein
VNGSLQSPLSESATRTATPAERRLRGWSRLAGEVTALVYIALIAQIAYSTGAFYVLFPELGALSHDVFTRPRGTWASAPFLLAITPVLAGGIGIVFTRALPYGYVSVLFTVIGAVALIMVLRSPIAPAISAGLLPLVLGVKSWWYPPGILLGTALLAGLSIGWKRLSVARKWLEPLSPAELLDEAVEQLPPGWYWLAALIAFVAVAVFCVEMSAHPAVQRYLHNSRELRFILFPPLVVIGFEMFGHTAICPWAKKPMLLPAACFTTALGGLFFYQLLGHGAAAAASSMAWGIATLRLFDLHVPPALAVALLPQVMDSPTMAYPVSVGVGTLLMTLWFLSYQSLVRNLRKR